jgi:V/A-type H+/Na+-transporting ATPase subunit D
MAARSLAPTKTNLMSLRQELEFAELGHELLDQKRNILVIELLNLVDQAVDYEQRVDAALADAYHDEEEATLRMGRLGLHSVGGAVDIDAETAITQRRVMGVRLPVVETSFTEHPPYFSPTGTSFWADAALVRFREALELIGKLAELKVSIVRLASEVKKTIRKVNALEKIAIPELKESAKVIQERLEENERDMFVLMKMVKSRLEGKKGAVS